MSLILIVLIMLLLFGGGGYYYGGPRIVRGIGRPFAHYHLFSGYYSEAASKLSVA
jgi:hypothetical protein